ncbi:hypothetical protein [Catellatospora sp. NPDC049609]|uniref:LppU/SCO3897 family protein n=1 Tax=Catellatospora sp. NPDC049609 TaxID=3155505 RepID=UPI003419E683
MSEQVTPAVPESTEPEQKSSVAGGIGKKILGYGLAAAVVFGGGLAYKYLSGDTEIAKAGDCITDAADADDMKVVGCDKPEAKYKVLGVLEDVSQTEADSDTGCGQWPATTDLFSIMEVGKTKGKFLCLGPVA